MIARDSKSYPYLAIAQYYGVDYGEVLMLSDYIKYLIINDMVLPEYTSWRFKIWELEHAKQN